MDPSLRGGTCRKRRVAVSRPPVSSAPPLLQSPLPLLSADLAACPGAVSRPTARVLQPSGVRVALLLGSDLDYPEPARCADSEKIKAFVSLHADTGFPPICRQLALLGAELLIVPVWSETPIWDNICYHHPLTGAHVCARDHADRHTLRRRRCGAGGGTPRRSRHPPGALRRPDQVKVAALLGVHEQG